MQVNAGGLGNRHTIPLMQIANRTLNHKPLSPKSNFEVEQNNEDTTPQPAQNVSFFAPLPSISRGPLPALPFSWFLTFGKVKVEGAKCHMGQNTVKTGAKKGHNVTSGKIALVETHQGRKSEIWGGRGKNKAQNFGTPTFRGLTLWDTAPKRPGDPRDPGTP